MGNITQSCAMCSSLFRKFVFCAVCSNLPPKRQRLANNAEEDKTKIYPGHVRYCPI